MIKITSLSTHERKQEMIRKWEGYKELYYTSTLTAPEMRKKLDVGVNTEAYKFIQKQLKKELITPHQRAKLILKGCWLS